MGPWLLTSGIVGSNPADGMDVCLMVSLRVVQLAPVRRADHSRVSVFDIETSGLITRVYLRLISKRQ